MRVLVTGHHGYIGSVLAPFLAACRARCRRPRHELFRGCDFGAERKRSRAASRTSATSCRPTWSASTRSSTWLPCRTIRSETSTRGMTRRRQLRRNAAAREGRARGGGAAVRVRLLVLDVRRVRDDEALDESAPLRPLTAYAESKVRAEEGLFALAAPDFAPVSMRNGDGLRRVATPPARHRAQQPRGLGAHDRAHPAPERRHRVAAARPRAGHREGGSYAARGARGSDPGRGVQHRHRRAELPRSRARRDPRDRHRLRDRDRRRLVRGPALVSRRLLEARPHLPRPHARLGRGARGTRARRRVPGGRPHAGRTSTATATSGSGGCSRCGTPGSSTASSAGSCRSPRNSVLAVRGVRARRH